MTAVRAPQPAQGEVVIGPMRRRHLRSVLRIENQVYPRPWSMGLFVSELTQRTARSYVVARSDEGVVGYCGLMFAVDDAHITTIAVDPAHHRQHLGTRLMLVQTAEAIRRGAEALTLEVRVSNEGAQALYQRFGFAPAGIRRNYYMENREDALVMWAHDIGSDDYRRRLDEIEASLPFPTVVEPAVAVTPTDATGGRPTSDGADPDQEPPA